MDRISLLLITCLATLTFASIAKFSSVLTPNPNKEPINNIAIFICDFKTSSDARLTKAKEYCKQNHPDVKKSECDKMSENVLKEVSAKEDEVKNEYGDLAYPACVDMFKVLLSDVFFTQDAADQEETRDKIKMVLGIKYKS